MKLPALILPPDPEASLEHEERLDGTDVRFRLATGGDQEATAELAITDPEAAARQLLHRCILGAPQAEESELRIFLSERLAALDPQAETIVQADCPACGVPTRLLVDAAPLVFARMSNPRRLMAEIDCIARSYHWSEREILALPSARRAAYLALIEDAGSAP